VWRRRSLEGVEFDEIEQVLVRVPTSVPVHPKGWPTATLVEPLAPIDQCG
jgi:hypothetical protein